MYKILLFLLAFQGWAPVLYEGRYQPLETLPPQEQNIEKLKEEGRLPFDHNLEEYRSLEGKPYQFAHGKALLYPTQRQLQAELFLHRFPFKWILIIGYCVAIFIRRFAAIPFILHTLLLATICYVLQRPPVSNMADTLFYVPWIAVLFSFIIKRAREGAAIAALLLLFLPSTFHFQNVQAVLDSQYWLIIHVLMVVGSYGLFFLAGIFGHIYLLKQSIALEKALLRTLYIGTALLIGGTILGGVWAAESWGRFWDWDPKEAWAFVSSALYLIWIHAYRFKKIKGFGLALGSIIGLMAITFTWYGVNYILSAGLHSYGFGSGGQLFYFLYLGAELLYIALFSIYKKWGIEKKDLKG